MSKAVKVMEIGKVGEAEVYKLMSEIKIYSVRYITKNLYKFISNCASQFIGYIDKHSAIEYFYNTINGAVSPNNLFIVETAIKPGTDIIIVKDEYGYLVIGSNGVITNTFPLELDITRLKCKALENSNTDTVKVNCKEDNNRYFDETSFKNFCNIMNIDIELIEKIHSIYIKGTDRNTLYNIVQFAIKEELEKDKFLILLNIFAAHNIDLRVYIKDFTNKQLDVIVKGIKYEVDICKLAYPHIPAEAMEIILNKLIAEKAESSDLESSC